MLDLDSFYRSPNESWADMMDEEENLASSDHDDPDALDEIQPKSSTTVATQKQEVEKETTAPAAAAGAPSIEAGETRPRPETQSKKSNVSGIVWRIPSAQERDKQKAVLEFLVEQRRLNIDKLDSWRPKDDDDTPKMSASDLATSWRRPIQKYERIPVRPVEENNVQGWASYSETLQKQYDEECEAAKKEFARRFGSSSVVKESKMAEPAPLITLITADGPSDWADDIPISIDESNVDEQSQEAQEEECSERPVAEEELSKELDTKLALENVDAVKDNQGAMEQPEDPVWQYHAVEEQEVGATDTVVTNPSEEIVTGTLPTADNVTLEEGSMRWSGYEPSSNDNDNSICSHDMPSNKNFPEPEHKSSSPPPPRPIEDASSRWISFALEETRRHHGPSRSPGNHPTTASSSTSTVESKGQNTSQYSSDDSNGARVLSHSSSTTTETSGNVHQLHQPPAPPKVRSALSQITSYLLKNAPSRNVSPTPGHARPHPAPIPGEQPQQDAERTDTNNGGEDHKVQVSPSARETPIVVARKPPTDHPESNALSPSSSVQGWPQPATSPDHHDRSQRLSASPANRSSGRQCPSPRTQFQGRDHRSASPSSGETQEVANTSWQSFARSHSAHPPQSYPRG